MTPDQLAQRKATGENKAMGTATNQENMEVQKSLAGIFMQRPNKKSEEAIDEQHCDSPPEDNYEDEQAEDNHQ